MIDPTGRYVIKKKGVILFISIFCLIQFSIVFTVPLSIENVILAFFYAALFFVFFYLGFYYTYAFFERDVFHMVKILILRNTIPVMNIVSLRRKHTFAGAFSGIEVTYKNDSGRIKQVMVPISAFGTKSVAAILHKFLEINSSIKVDSSAQELMRKFL